MISTEKWSSRFRTFEVTIKNSELRIKEKKMKIDLKNLNPFPTQIHFLGYCFNLYSFLYDY
jgi:hypothetical protein